MKKTYSFLIVLLFLISSCKQSFLDTENLTKKSSANFPGTPVEAQQALTGVYSIQNTVGTGWNNILLVSDYMSDDRFGGGGMHDVHPQAISYFRIDLTNRMSDKWAGYYQGIYRANTLLSALGNVKGLSKADRKNVVGETSFLRGLFYFDLARLFSSPEVVDGHQVTVPLVLETIPADLPRATEDAMYGQIAMDFKTAIDSLPAAPINVAWRAANLGRANKYAAEGMMARMFLFYTGYYGKTEIVMPNGQKITKDMVKGYVDDVIANSGSSLISDFRNQWPYSFSAPGVPTTYKYAVTNGLKWVGEANNTENIYEVVFTGFASAVWGEKSNYTNGFFNCGQRDSKTYNVIGHGWGFGPVNPRLYDEWPVGDLRKQGSIYNVDDPAEAVTYTKAADSQWNETYYLDKKYIPVNVDYKSLVAADNGKIKTGNWCHALYPGIEENIQLESVQNMVLLRLADVYLMGAELGSAQAQVYMDAVRTRAGLPSVAVNLDNIKKERHYELAFEGIRYFDLLRWYGKDGAGDIIKANKTGAVIYNQGLKTTIDQDRGAGFIGNIPQRVKVTGGFLMIPQDQIDLSTVLKQNPGWTVPGEYAFEF
jgi:hypothetical protein